MRSILRWIPVTLLLSGLAATASKPDGNHSQVSEEKQKVRVVAERFHFTPSRITVPQGTLLAIELSSEDTFHGFRVPKANIDVTIPARRRESITVLFSASEKGKYAFECSRPCGAGHTLMRGVIVVE